MELFGRYLNLTRVWRASPAHGPDGDRRDQIHGCSDFSTTKAAIRYVRYQHRRVVFVSRHSHIGQMNSEADNVPAARLVVVRHYPATRIAGINKRDFSIRKIVKCRVPAARPLVIAAACCRRHTVARGWPLCACSFA